MKGARNILVLTYWSYSDALIQAYTLPYLRIMLRVLPSGSRVHLVTLEKQPVAKANLSVDQGITVHQRRYRPFGARGIGMILGLVVHLLGVARKERIDTIHAWCTPAGMIGYLLSLASGKPLIIDSYEPHAEAMVENGTWSRSGIAFRVLFLFERLQSRRARVLIAASSGMQEYAHRKYGLSGKPFFVKPACVDLEVFSLKKVGNVELAEELGLNGKLVAVYAGKFGGIYWDQEVFDLLRVAHEHWGERFHALILTGHDPEELDPYIRAAGLDPAMLTVMKVPHAAIPDHVGLGDFALTPVRPVPTKRLCTPIKDGEYWALGLPVMITPGISDDSDIITRERIGCVIRAADTKAYEEAVREMDQLLNSEPREVLRSRVRAVAEKYRHLRIAEKVYEEVYGTA
jgi:glycosyltransferase involved in cell wall biosynthesis